MALLFTVCMFLLDKKMRNLILNEETTFKTNTLDGNLIAIDSLNECVYIASQREVTCYNLLTKKVSFILFW